MHIYMPLGAKYTYEQSREFARVIAILAHARLPGFTSIERTVKDRQGKLYIDFLQKQTSGHCLRPFFKPRTGRSMSQPPPWPGSWEGLEKGRF